MQILAIPGNRGTNILGGKEGAAGKPFYIYKDVKVPDNLSGTVGNGGVAGNTITTTADLTSVLSKGNYARLGTSPNPRLIWIKDIDATTITMGDPDTHEAISVAIAAATTIKKWVTTEIGLTDDKGVKFKSNDKVAPLKFAQRGDVESNHAGSGIEEDFEFTIAELSLEKLSLIFPDTFHIQRDVDGEVVALARKDNLGKNYSITASRFSFISAAGAGPSEDPKERLDVYKATLIFNLEFERTATTQLGVKVMGKIYKDSAYKINGEYVTWAINPDAITLD